MVVSKSEIWVVRVAMVSSFLWRYARWALQLWARRCWAAASSNCEIGGLALYLRGFVIFCCSPEFVLLKSDGFKLKKVVCG
jgi:hypothetical protein